jgi:hypothetical protein
LPSTPPDGFDVTVYPVMVAPPASDGARKETDAWFGEDVAAVTLVGTPGAVFFTVIFMLDVA